MFYVFILFIFSAIYENYCEMHYSNGHCDFGCNNRECRYDGGDCAPSQDPPMAHGALGIILLMDITTFRNASAAFLWEMARVLRTIVRYKEDQFGDDMIEPWSKKSREGSFG